MVQSLTNSAEGPEFESWLGEWRSYERNIRCLKIVCDLKIEGAFKFLVFVFYAEASKSPPHTPVRVEDGNRDSGKTVL